MCPIFLLETYKATRKALYGEGKTWVCPKEMFFEDVTLADGSVVKRFAPVKSWAECANIMAPVSSQFVKGFNDPHWKVLKDNTSAELSGIKYVVFQNPEGKIVATKWEERDNTLQNTKKINKNIKNNEKTS